MFAGTDAVEVAIGTLAGSVASFLAIGRNSGNAIVRDAFAYDPAFTGDVRFG